MPGPAAPPLRGGRRPAGPRSGEGPHIEEVGKVMAGPLRGIRVIEPCRFISGPLAGMLLGDLGADVVKIEHPQGGDPFRGRPTARHPFAPIFGAYNRNKQSVTLDLSTPQGRDVYLAVGSHTRMPRRYRGMDIFWWLDQIGALDRTVDQLRSTAEAQREPSLQLVGRTTGGEVDLPTLLAHGTTVATNALLERRGARVALVTTEGFADVIEIGRQDRPSLYDIWADRPEPLVPRELRFEVGGRLDAYGAEIEPLPTVEPVRAAADDGRRPAAPVLPDGVAAAVCLLHSDLNPAHERAVTFLRMARDLLPAGTSEARRLSTEG